MFKNKFGFLQALRAGWIRWTSWEFMPREAGKGAGSRAGVIAGNWELLPSWIWAQAGISPCSGCGSVGKAREGTPRDSGALRWSIDHRGHQQGWGAQDRRQLWGRSHGEGDFFGRMWQRPACDRVSLALCVPAVMGAVESRGVLRRMSDMLEMLMKRMDILARLENSTDFHKGDEARFPLDRSVSRADAPGRPCGAVPCLGGLQEQKAPMCSQCQAELPRGDGGAHWGVGLGQVVCSPMVCHFWKPFLLGFLKLL